jgi:single-strand DNA-binding protein
MSHGFNRVTLFGNLGAEPELRTTPAGHAVMTFRLATNEVWFDKDQTKQERTEWHNIVMFGKRATPLSHLLAKGERVLVEGRLQTSTYEKDGIKRWKTEVVASDVCLAQTRVGREMSARGAAPAELEDNVPF